MATARAGWRPTGRSAIYATGGIGVERVRIGVDPPSTPDSYTAPDFHHRTYSGFAFGGDGSLFITDRLGLRVEYRRLESGDGYDPDRYSGGIVYRF